MGQGIFQVYWKTSILSLVQTVICNSEMSLEHLYTHFTPEFFWSLGWKFLLPSSKSGILNMLQ